MAKFDFKLSKEGRDFLLKEEGNTSYIYSDGGNAAIGPGANIKWLPAWVFEESGLAAKGKGEAFKQDLLNKFATADKTKKVKIPVIKDKAKLDKFADKVIEFQLGTRGSGFRQRLINDKKLEDFNKLNQEGKESVFMQFYRGKPAYDAIRDQISPGNESGLAEAIRVRPEPNAVWGRKQRTADRLIQSLAKQSPRQGPVPEWAEAAAAGDFPPTAEEEARRQSVGASDTQFQGPPQGLLQSVERLVTPKESKMVPTQPPASVTNPLTAMAGLGVGQPPPAGPIGLGPIPAPQAAQSVPGVAPPGPAAPSAVEAEFGPLGALPASPSGGQPGAEGVLATLDVPVKEGGDAKTAQFAKAAKGALGLAQKLLKGGKKEKKEPMRFVDVSGLQPAPFDPLLELRRLQGGF